MKILFIGDVVGMRSCEALKKALRGAKQKLGAEIVIVNGENSAEGNGINPASADAIFEAGADVITTGNHCFGHQPDGNDCHAAAGKSVPLCGQDP